MLLHDPPKLGVHARPCWRTAFALLAGVRIAAACVMILADCDEGALLC